MTYQDVLEYLESFIDYEKTPVENYSCAFKLDRVERLLASLGDPHKGLKVIHVAGTKGKGSTSALIASILNEANLRVGLYTSPHLISFRERIMVDGRMIDEEALIRIVAENKPHFERLRGERLSFFEVYTAVAFLYFKEMRVDLAVLEVGLGGRLDATNVADSLISVITPISLEHTHILGETLGKIAKEKAAIIKRDSFCVSAPQEKEVLDVIEDDCRQRGSRLYLVGREIQIDKVRFDKSKQYFNIWGRSQEYPLLELGLMGAHQVVNAAAAIGAIEALKAYDIFIPQESVKQGVAKTRWPGRMEVMREEPLIILDGAQNVASAKALTEAVERHFVREKLILVLGISYDKDIKGVCETLSSFASQVILTRADNPRAAEPGILEKYINNKPVQTFSNTKDALESACEKATKDDIILIAGSLYLVGEMRKILKDEEEKQPR
jgi:dihydrofolate synthase/folylpolyglutamate synthase